MSIKTILSFKKTSNTKDIFGASNGETIIIPLSGETSISVKSKKQLSERRIESGALVMDHSTVEPDEMSISGEISDIPAVLMNNIILENMQPGDGPTEKIRIITGYYNSVAESILNHPGEFAKQYREMFEVLALRNDIVFNVEHPKTGKTTKNWFVVSIDINESEGAYYGFKYSINLKQIIFGTSQKANNAVIGGNTVTTPLVGKGDTTPAKEEKLNTYTVIPGKGTTVVKP